MEYELNLRKVEEENEMLWLRANLAEVVLNWLNSSWTSCESSSSESHTE